MPIYPWNRPMQGDGIVEGLRVSGGRGFAQMRSGCFAGDSCEHVGFDNRHDRRIHSFELVTYWLFLIHGAVSVSFWVLKDQLPVIR